MEAIKLQKLIDYLKNPQFDNKNWKQQSDEIFQICKEIILEGLPDEELIEHVAFELNECKDNPDIPFFIQDRIWSKGAKWMKSKIKELR